MNAPVLSRRHLLGATAAVGALSLPALAEAGIPAALAADSDAELSALLDRFNATRAAWDAADAQVGNALRRAVSAYPERPDALRRRPGDFLGTSIGIGAADPAEADGTSWYGARGVEWLRGYSPMVVRFPPGAFVLDECRDARRKEIVEAYDAWAAARRRVEDEVGLTAATEADDAAGQAWNPADDAVKLYQPRTLAGLARKAAWVADRLAIGNCDDDLGEVFARQVAAFGGAAS